MIHKSQQKKLIIMCIVIGILLFYAINAIISDILYNDYHQHISQLLHFRKFFSMDFTSFVETAPLRRGLVHPGWQILLLPIYGLWRLLSLSFDDSARLGAALLTALYNAVAVYAIGIVLYKHLKTKFGLRIAPLLAAIVIFCGPLYVPAINNRYYLGQLFSGVWHNPTTQPVKFFIIVVFFLYYHMLTNREKLQKETIPWLPFKIGKLNGCYILMATLLLVSALFKSSLNLVFIPALFIFCCIDVITTRLKSFRFCFMLGLSVIPACVLIVIQSMLLRDIGNTEIVISFMTVWNEFAPVPLLSILISLPFPLYVICINIRQIYKNKMMLLSFILLAISVLEFAFLAVEPGMFFGDFSWGMHLSTLVFFVTSLIAFDQSINENKQKTLKVRLIAIIGYLILLAQFLYGCDYLLRLVEAKGNFVW